MTTQKQAAANKANARKSSGPTSAGGKATSAQNAVKHGVTGRPDWSMVTRFYRIIVEDISAVPDPFSQDARLRAALALAEAAAGLQRAADAEREYIFQRSRKALRKMGTRQDFIELVAELDLDDIDTLEFLMAQTRNRDELTTLRIFKQVSPQRPAEQARALKRLARYRREAAARRRKALAHWISVQAENPETNPFTTYE